MTSSKRGASLHARLRWPMAVGLSRLFRFGMPPLVVLCWAGVIPWWIVLVPVLPFWLTVVRTIHAAEAQAAMIRPPRRPMSLDEAAAERRYLFAKAALDTAKSERAQALWVLAVTRSEGDAAIQSATLRWRAGQLVRRWGGPPSPS